MSFYVEGLSLPAVRPERDQLQEAETVSQRDAERIDEIRDVVDVEVAENIRVLKIQREHQAYHVREPSDGTVRQTGPDPDEAEADLDGSADGSRAHYLAWDRATALTVFSSMAKRLSCERRYSEIKH